MILMNGMEQDKVTKVTSHALVTISGLGLGRITCFGWPRSIADFHSPQQRRWIQRGGRAS
jgi:hypothetical protein